MNAQIGQTEKTQGAFIMYENVLFIRGKLKKLTEKRRKKWLVNLRLWSTGAGVPQQWRHVQIICLLHWVASHVACRCACILIGLICSTIGRYGLIKKCQKSSIDRATSRHNNTILLRAPIWPAAALFTPHAICYWLIASSFLMVAWTHMRASRTFINTHRMINALQSHINASGNMSGVVLACF